MPTELTHRIRSDIFANDRTYSLGSGALCWEDGGVEDQIQFSDIDQIRLIAYPSLGSDQHRCIVRGKTGQKVKLGSLHYKNLGSFEDRSQSYAEFVRELTRRVASANPQTKLVVGSTALWLLWIALFLVAGLAIILIAILFIMALIGRAPLKPGLIAVLVIMVIMIPKAWRAVRRGRERSFDPSTPSFSIFGREKETP